MCSSAPRSPPSERPGGSPDGRFSRSIAGFLGTIAGLRHNAGVSPNPPRHLRQQVPLAPLSSLGTGGQARWFSEATSLDGLREALAWANSQSLPVVVLGGGSNVVFTDGSFDGLVLEMALRGRERLETDRPGVERWRVAAGETWDDFVDHCCHLDLAGIECLSGIPGSVGATPIQNVGAYGQEVCQVIRSVTCLDRQSLEDVELSNADCHFAYRSSRFKHGDAGRYVVLSVEFELQPGAAPSLHYAELERLAHQRQLTQPSLLDARRLVLDARRSKSMLLDPDDPNGRSCGSFFVNAVLSAADFERLLERTGPDSPPHYVQADGSVKVPSAWLIQHAGFDKGHRRGNVGLSTKHTLCVVAHEGATSSEVVDFARSVRDRVWDVFRVPLQPEPVFVGIEW